MPVHIGTCAGAMFTGRASLEKRRHHLAQFYDEVCWHVHKRSVFMLAGTVQACRRSWAESSLRGDEDFDVCVAAKVHLHCVHYSLASYSVCLLGHG